MSREGVMSHIVNLEGMSSSDSSTNESITVIITVNCMQNVNTDNIDLNSIFSTYCNVV